LRSRQWLPSEIGGDAQVEREALRTAGLVERLEALEMEVAALEATLAAPAAQVRPVPTNIDELYQIRVRDLATSVADPLIREEAIVHMRALTERVEVAGAEERPADRSGAA
jgi:hypothetical protein